jgi:hypothetical protein
MSRPVSAQVARRRATIFALVIAGLFFSIVIVNVAPDIAYWWGARELRASSEEVDGPDVRLGGAPTTYRAVYRVENRAGGRLVVNTEKVWFRRPFESRIETYRGGGTDGERSSLRQSTFGTLANVSTGTDQPLNLAAPPSLASGDIRFDAVIAEGLAEKEIAKRERREVYGRACQVYRAGGPVSAGDVTRYDPKNDETYADVCLDEHGIILEEYWVEKGRLLRRRVATELAVDVKIDPDLFEIRTPNNPKIDRGTMKKIDDDTESRVPLWLPPKTPAGFERLGRYSVILSKQAAPQLGGVALPSASSASEVFVRGPDLIVIDQDPSLTAVASQESRPMRDIDIGPLGRGKLIIDARMSEVRALTDEGSLVRVFGTVKPSELIRLARTLQPAQTG